MAETILQNESVDHSDTTNNDEQLQDLQSQQQPLRQSSRIKKPTSSNDYVYLQESEFDLGDIDDPLSYF